MASGLVFVEAEDSGGVIIIWSTIIGDIVCICVSIILMIQIYLAYVKMNESKSTNTYSTKDSRHSNKISKAPFVFVILYLFSISFSRAIKLITKTNIFTLDNTYFSSTRCQIGNVSSHLFHGLSTTILSFLFLHRIRSVFKHSAFDYPPWIYKAFIIFILSPLSMVGASLWLVQLPESQGSHMSMDPSTFLSFCSTDAPKVSYSAVATTFGILSVLNSFGLLGLFVRGLWKLKMSLTLQFMEEVEASEQNLSPIVVEQKRNSKLSSQDIVLDEWNKNDKSNQEKKSIERIIKLHNLIKKQSILVFVAVLTDVLMYGVVPFNFSLRNFNSFDYAMNGICVWMMLGTSKPYWIFCKRHGICSCCYCKTNKLGL